MLELFIYYRVAASHAAQVLPVVQRWQAALRERHPGLQTRLLKRAPQAPLPDAQTWMETYAMGSPPPGRDLIAELQRELAAGPPELAGGLATERHAEAFEPCAS